MHGEAREGEIVLWIDNTRTMGEALLVQYVLGGNENVNH